MAFSQIPVIDLGGLRSPDLSDRKAVAAEIRHASHHVGFFYIANHGIPAEAIAATFAQTKHFFDQPLAVKNTVSITQSPISRGYEAIRQQALDQIPDLKEGYYIGVDRGADDPLVQTGTPNHGANQWPTNLPGWQEPLEAYFAMMQTLACQLMGALALSLDLDEPYFDGMLDHAMSVLRLLHYPPHPVDAMTDQLGCGAHTDWGGLTILLQDQVGGLEVCNADGNWIKAEPIPETFVINLGDMMARWTNDYYQSTLHRVINRSGKERYSMPFFFDLNYHALVECLPTCQGATNPPKYPPITAGEHIMEMYRKTYQVTAAIA
ncbi:isopenicillin N synthase family dioxygenase [Stenomitos frigidus]|uniref:Isopenicillin N synthase family oxygenase n=1 Tax=Stenomitos frigidus ULC18 TaxID=2107698 RepID=A0A2T1E9M2_9CYAN|nr:2-oxoglutarate and iron-dependent oxygenase domain-containing protein [Stenomitos frigidus]PSB29411.1 isopenicillin N synthase family oxygenase [Stenomitos frigidus ULC18]